MDQEIQKLKREIEDLKKWREEKTKQQISFPLDRESIKILNENFMSITDTIIYESGVGGNIFFTYFGKQGVIDFEVSPISLIPFSVNVTTNYVTTLQASGNIKFFDNFTVEVVSTGTLPSPLAIGTTYYVINSDGYTFQLSLAQGGAPEDITDTGSGNHYIR